MSEKETILSSIRALGAKVLPEGARLILFGSQARNDAREDSDWDLLILLNDQQLQNDIFGTYAYPFVELGWEYGTYFSPKIYTYAEWAKRKGTLFYDNIDREGVILCWLIKKEKTLVPTVEVFLDTLEQLIREDGYLD